MSNDCNLPSPDNPNALVLEVLQVLAGKVPVEPRGMERVSFEALDSVDGRQLQLVKRAGAEAHEAW